MSIFSSLVLGASTNPNRYSYKAVLSLKQNGYNVIAVGNKEGKVHGVSITKTFPNTELDTITIYLGKKNQLAYYEPILSSNARRIIFNPGAENNELATLASKKGIEIVEGCTLVMLTLKQY